MLALQGDAEAAIARASANFRRLEVGDDPLFPTAILRGRRLLGCPLDDRSLLAAWRPGRTRETGAVRYRWAVDPRHAGAPPAWVGPEAGWAPSRPGDAEALADSPDRKPSFVARLITPLVLADMLEVLGQAVDRADDGAELALCYLDEALPKVRRDAASWVQELHAWSDTWALWALTRRPRALGALHPFARAIADAYAAAARRDGGRVLGTRYPYHGVPLASGSAQLATGLVSLGFHPKLVGTLAGWVRSEQREDGGWGDGAFPSDVLTTLVAADLLATLDPAYEPSSTAAWLARAQRPDGWWRGFGPESTWLSAEILGWLLEASRPFADRFRWPHLALANRDRRTGLPFYGYFSDLERLFAEVPALAAAMSRSRSSTSRASARSTTPTDGPGDAALRHRPGASTDPGRHSDPRWGGRVHRRWHADREGSHQSASLCSAPLAAVVRRRVRRTGVVAHGCSRR